MKGVLFLMFLLWTANAQSKVYFLSQQSNESIAVLEVFDETSQTLDSLHGFSRMELIYPKSKLAYDDYYHRVYGFGVNLLNETRFFEYDLIKESIRFIAAEVPNYQRNYDFDLKYHQGKLILVSDSTGVNQAGLISVLDLNTGGISHRDLSTAGQFGFYGSISEVTEDGKLYFFSKKGGAANLGAALEFDVASSSIYDLFDFNTTPQFTINEIINGVQGAPQRVGDSIYFATHLGGVNGFGGVYVYNYLDLEMDKIYDFVDSNQVFQIGALNVYNNVLTLLSDYNTVKNDAFVLEVDLTAQDILSLKYLDSAVVAVPSGGLSFHENEYFGIANYSSTGNQGALYNGQPNINLSADLTDSVYQIQGQPLFINMDHRPKLNFSRDTTAVCDGSDFVLPFTVTNPNGFLSHTFEVYSDNPGVVPKFNAVVSGAFPSYQWNITPLLNTSGVVHLTLVYDNGYDHEVYYHTVFVKSYISVQDSLVLPQNLNDGEIYLDISGDYTQINWSNGVADTNNIFNLSEGMYSVSIIDDNLCTFTASFELTQEALSISESVFEGLQVFPNPGANVFHVRGVNAQLSVYNLNGQLLEVRSISEMEVVNTASWEPGIYFLHFEKEGGSKVLKWIKGN